MQQSIHRIEVLVHRCGTLDCHGSSFRNFRVYGDEGLRLAAGDIHVISPTTVGESDQTFLSLVTLEPEVLTHVVREGGGAPERLSLIRKARGLDDHKGGTVMSAGDDQDRCFTSWLANQPDENACKRSLLLP